MIQITQYFNTLKAAGIVKTEAELGHWMGKSPSYVSGQKSKGKPISLEALTHLAINLDAHLAVLEQQIRKAETAKTADLVAASAVFEVRNAVQSQIRTCVFQHSPFPGGSE